MADPKVMWMVSESLVDSDGFTPLYHAGELHEVGDLPPNVPYKVVVADDAMRSQASSHAQQPKAAEVKPAAVKTESKSGK